MSNQWQEHSNILSGGRIVRSTCWKSFCLGGFGVTSLAAPLDSFGFRIREGDYVFRIVSISCHRGISHIGQSVRHGGDTKYDRRLTHVVWQFPFGFGCALAGCSQELLWACRFFEHWPFLASINWGTWSLTVEFSYWLSLQCYVN